MTKTFLNQKQKFELGTLIHAHCVTAQDGKAVYEQGWDDEMIAKTFGPPVTYIHVRELRRNLIGHMHKVGKRGVNTVAQRLNDIENYLTSKNPDWKVKS